MHKHTPLYEQHVAAGARLTGFGGWDMPLHYGSQIEEHHAVRNAAGMFDVSHMTVVDITGVQARSFLRRLLANDIDKLTAPGPGLYSCMLNESGGVVDDLIAYRTKADAFRLVVNATTRAADLRWMSAVAGDDDVAIRAREGMVMIAVQGPEARRLFAPALADAVRSPALELAPFHCLDTDGLFIARTGYTGEDGWELVVDAAVGIELWAAGQQAGIAPCGLGARDTLRLEAGLCLYGQDMDVKTSPLVANLGWTVAWDPPDRAFIGREALAAQRAGGVQQKLVGLVLEDRGIMRHGQRVLADDGEGVVTSGGFSPTMQRSVALARVPARVTGACQVEIRNTFRLARVVRPPFVRNGRVLVSLQTQINANKNQIEVDS